MAAAVALVLPGCALSTAAPPIVEVADVQLRGIGLLDQVLAVSLCLTNPNNAELAFRRVAVAIDIAGAPIADSASDTGVRLPPQSSVLVPFTVITTVRNVGPQLLGVIRAGSLEYRLHGTVQLGGGLYLPFSRSGHLNVLEVGSDLIADAAAPTGTRCETGRV